MTATDHKGVCQFTINDREFSIYAARKGREAITFSVEKGLEPEEETSELTDHALEVVALKEVPVNRREKINLFIMDSDALGLSASMVKRAFIIWKGNVYAARHGGIQTPVGWIFA